MSISKPDLVVSRVTKCVRSIPVLLMALVSVAMLFSSLARGAAPETTCCDRATEIISDLHSIVTPHGIEMEETITIGAIDQFISVRGRNPENPVLLVLHGGPGWVTSPISWWVSQGWEEYFTVIHWDQRGAGKTYAMNDPEEVAPTMTRAHMDADVDEVVQWARSRFGKERIFVLGHSWGSLLGLSLAERRPEWLHAYVGVGQWIDFYESERRGWRWAFARAQAAENSKALADLASLTPYAETGSPPSLDDLFLQRRWLNHFGGGAYNRPGAGFESAAFRLSPLYSAEDVSIVFEAQEYSMRHLFDEAIEANFQSLHRLEVPVFLFLGRHDHNVSATLAAEWFEGLDVPFKRLVWFDHSAHEVMAEEPGKVLVTLVEHVRPRAGDFSSANALRTN